MHVKNIYLKNYRNYEQQTIELNKGINIFYGQNAQGKTNVIESIYLSSTGKSHRTQKDSELIRWNAEDARVRIQYERDQDENTIDMYLKLNHKKQVKVNGVRLNKIGELLGNLNTVIFSPDHMKIIKEGPAERRRFVDIILSQSRPGYYYNLSQYVKVLEQRNNLLNEAKKDKSLLKTLDVWDEQLTSFGTRIVLERLDFIDTIDVFARETHGRITNGKEMLRLQYKSSVEAKERNAGDIKKTFSEELERFREIDFRRGVTHKGPHRDDIFFFINENDVKTYASQGQQRTALLSLKVSELKFIEAETQAFPVLLLDDVFSELDTERQKYLMEFIKDVQTIITCTDVQYFKNLNLKDFYLFHVSGGKIEKR